MSLAPGTRIGAYEITGAIGAGGMGEVYRARDTKLNRDVAIKVLPDAFAADPERLARFTREAQTLAALNHPNIAAIYGIEGDDGRISGTRALVMELVEGEDLSQHIARGAMPPGEVLPIARQIADALEAAHELGIVHRDLKPANIKVRADGTVKVLDFGLAKAMDPASSSTPDAANSPTLTAHATAMGVIVGTAAYMSPEQARGKSVDKRSDVWAFGAVLFEMLAGRPAFAGDTVTDIIAAVVTRDPDWTAIPASTPPAVLQLLTRCLDKDPKRRLRDIGDARFALEAERPSASASLAAGIPVPPAIPEPRRRPWGWMAATALLAIATTLFAASSWRAGRRAPPTSTFELAIAAPADAEFQVGSNSGNVIVSPDGTEVAFVAATSSAGTIWVRSLATDDARPLSGTEGASYPFWSPDGRRIAFFAAGKLRSVDIGGGLPEDIADATQGRGGSWGEDDTIIFTPEGGGTIVRVAASGGAVTPVTALDKSRGENAHYWPVLLPGGNRFIYFVRSTRVENGGIYLGRLDGSAPPVKVVASLSSGVVATRPSDGALYLLWVRDDELLAQPFDAEAGTLTGETVTIARGVRVEGSQRLTFASASGTGVVAWAESRAAESRFGRYNRDGRRLGTLAIPPGDLSEPELSPDGRRLAFLQVNDGLGDVVVHDLVTGATQRVSPSPDFDENPTWSADGETLFYSGRQDDENVLFRMALTGGVPPAVVVTDNFSLGRATSDGRFILFTTVGATTGLDLMAKPLTGDGTPVPLLAGPRDEGIASLSADDRWAIVYDSASTASIRRFSADGGTPALGAPFSLGVDFRSGQPPVIRRDGREVLISAADGTLQSIPITPAGDGVILGAPQTLFRLPAGDGTFSVTANGTEFVVTETPFAAGQTLRVLTNWEARLVR